jgi:hypothetical protein
VGVKENRGKGELAERGEKLEWLGGGFDYVLSRGKSM